MVHKLDFPKGRSLDTRIAVYVPSTEFDKKIPKKEFERRVKDVSDFLAREFGGVTVVSGVGSWRTNGKIIKESIVKVESFSPYKKYIAEDLKVENFLKGKVNEWKQKALSYEYESPSTEHSSLYLVRGVGI